MQDEILGRVWTAGHDRFAADVDRGATAISAAIGSSARRIAPLLSAVLLTAVLAAATLAAGETAAVLVFTGGLHA